MRYKIAFRKNINYGFYDKLIHILIKLRTFGKYSHCEFIDTNNYISPNLWTWISVSTNSSIPNARELLYFDENEWDVYDLPENIDYSESLKWVFDNLIVRYDYLGIFFSQLFNINIEDKEKYFCSEFIALQLKKTSLLCDDTTPAHYYSPNKLFHKLNNMGALTKWQR